ncbi:DUF3990 domain-containing protein (plasmid) [Limosilactobacillus reuteri]|uniref:DUF3990 domain-containing protein n=1 Tax=Limosilactobacillus reuteri TaxID=1598 RepID=A0A517D8M8_LIMRT|nr:DUF3990 domain-containing protein [Limosilactobacillus reuteri]
MIDMPLWDVNSMENIIKLYHGSDVMVIIPEIMHTQRTHDFWDAFYLTTSITPAENWARYVAKKEK